MLETINRQQVGVAGRSVVILRPRKNMTPDEALLHAAWLVALAEPQARNTFADVLDAVRRT